MKKKIIVILLCFCALSLQTYSQGVKQLVPVLDPASGNYLLYNNTIKAHDAGYYNSVTFGVPSEFYKFYLRNDTGSVLIDLYDKVYYPGKIICQRLFRIKKELFSITTDNHRFGLVNLSMRKNYLQGQLYKDYYLLDNKQKLIFIQDNNKGIEVLNILNGRIKSLFFKSEIKSFKESGLLTSGLVWYKTLDSIVGVIDINKGVEIFQCSGENILQVSTHQFVINRENKQSILYNISTKKFSDLDYDYVIEDRKQKGSFYIGRGKKLGIVDQKLNLLSPVKYSSIKWVHPNTYIVSEDKNEYYLINSFGKSFVQTRYNDLFAIGGFLLGVDSTSKTIDVYNRGIKKIWSKKGYKFMSWNGKTVCLQKNSQYVEYDLNRAAEVRRSDYLFEPTQSAGLYYYSKNNINKNNPVKKGLEMKNGRVLTPDKFSFLEQLSDKFFIGAEDIGSRMYLIDYLGKEYVVK